MRSLHSLKSALITGLFVVLPAWLALLLFLKILVKLGVIVRPIAGHLPNEVNHPQIIAFIVFVFVCLIVGLLFNTAIGKAIGRSIEGAVLDRIPGYSSLRSIAAKTAGFEDEHNFQPALIVVEDGCLAPAFLIETHEDGLSTVFMPSVPTPMAGGIFIMPSARVYPVDVPLTTMMRCISKWGTGSSEILTALKASGVKLPLSS
ncbi:DUF502 domain-containing protein [Haloferula chungangensis]|uniref:DUF502 domain-containing protein n=1 Tax=Haloferula chungangensis TaxID=1048331 RepID=A0ABW2LBT1_9BACT